MASSKGKKGKEAEDHFAPSDADILNILKQKVSDPSFNPPHIKEADPYSQSPRSLIKEHFPELKDGEEGFFIFRKDRDCSIEKRKVPGGYWECMGSENLVFIEKENGEYMESTASTSEKAKDAAPASASQKKKKKKKKKKTGFRKG